MRWGGSMKLVKAPESLGQSGEHTATNHLLQEPIQTFASSESATNFKGFETLHNIVLDIDDQVLCSDVQTEIEQMYDELWRLFEKFQRTVNKLKLNVKRKKFMHLQNMTLYDMFKQ